MKGILIVLAIAIALALLNPETRDFRDHVESKIGEQINAEGAGGIIGKMGAGAAALLAEQISVRKNYLLFSTFTIDIDGPESKDADWHYLGVAGMFFQLRAPDSESN